MLLFCLYYIIYNIIRSLLWLYIIIFIIIFFYQILIILHHIIIVPQIIIKKLPPTDIYSQIKLPKSQLLYVINCPVPLPRSQSGLFPASALPNKQKHTTEEQALSPLRAPGRVNKHGPKEKHTVSIH